MRAPTAGGGRLVIFVNDAGAVFQRSVIGGARDVAEKRGFEVAVRELPTPPADPAVVRELAAGAHGALVLANVVDEASLAALQELGIALTLVSRRAPALGAPAVLHDNRQGMSQLVGYVVAAGRRRPLFVRGHPEQLDGRERERHYRDELMRHELPVAEEYFLDGAFEPELAAAAVRRFLATGLPFDALVASDYLMALAALDELRASGHRVPAEVSVAAFGDGPEAEAAGLTTVAADVVELGRRAARQLLAQAEGGAIVGHTLLSTRLVNRAT